MLKLLEMNDVAWHYSQQTLHGNEPLLRHTELVNAASAAQLQVQSAVGNFVE